jgi:mono/diheme cytochrome c family protein
VIPALMAVSLLLGAEPADAKPVAPADQASLLAGRLPEEPGRALVQGKCLTCHTADYVTQQRLTPKQWQGTVEKMRRFGAPLTDDEVKLLSEYLGRHWTVDLPERPPTGVRPPAGSLPAGARSRPAGEGAKAAAKAGGSR